MVNWGIIGCGGIANRRMVPALPECCCSRVIAVMDADRAVTDEVAGKVGARAYYSEADLLADPDVQAVYIATPVYLHHRQALDAARAGKHILLEKPLALTLAEGEEIANGCRDAGVYLTEGYMMKHHSLNARAREMVQGGDIGPVVFARAQISCWYPVIPGAWRQDPKLGGGGALMDMATHCYDLLSYLMGSRITAVFAQTPSLTFDYPVEDSSVTLLRFANGAAATVDAFFNIPDNAAQSRLEVYGNKGSILAEGTIGQTPGGKMVAYVGDDSAAYDPQQAKDAMDVSAQPIECEPVNMYAAELDYLSRCIMEGREPALSTGAEGLRVLRIAAAAYESARTGKMIEVA